MGAEYQENILIAPPRSLERAYWSDLDSSRGCVCLRDFPTEVHHLIEVWDGKEVLFVFHFSLMEFRVHTARLLYTK